MCVNVSQCLYLFLVIFLWLLFFFLAYSVWFVFIFLLLLLLILDACFHCNERMKELVWVWVGGNGKDMEGVGDGKP